MIYSGPGNTCDSYLVLREPLVEVGTTPWDYNLVNFDVSTGFIQVEDQTTGALYDAYFIEPNNCFGPCLPKGVLHADALEMKDEGWQYAYADAGNPEIGTGNTLESELAAGNANEYRFGAKGIWRNWRNYRYQTNRISSGVDWWYNTDISTDGEYTKFNFFDWDDPSADTCWAWSNEITRYNPAGFAIESTNPLDIYASALFGYDNALQVATSSNAKYTEMAFDGFEDYDQVGGTPIYSGHGHLQFNGAVQLTADEAHTGDYSMRIPTGTQHTFISNLAAASDNFKPEVGNEKRYAISAWIKEVASTDVTVEVWMDNTPLASFTSADFSGTPIEGWNRLEGSFFVANTIANPSQFRLVVKADNGINEIYLDDLRIGPFTGGMMTYVYDPIILELRAELDANNYATFYSYDEEGSLVHVKKETERGIITLQTGRSNTVQVPNP